MRSIRTAMLLGSTLPSLLSGAALAQTSDLLVTADHVTLTGHAVAAAPRALAPGERSSLVRDLVTQNAGAAGSELALVQERTSKFGRVHQRFEQRIEGRRVYGAEVAASFAEDGQLMMLHERVRGGKGRLVFRARISATDALAVAIDKHFGGVTVPTAEGKDGFVTSFASTEFFYDPPEVEEVVVARTSGGLEVGYLVKTWAADTNELYHTLIDGRGRVAHVEDRTSKDQYGVFPDHPGNTSQVIAQGPGSGNAQSPQGWLYSGTQSRYDIAGNNVRAYLDTNNDNRPDSGGRTTADGSFITAAQLDQAPSTQANREAAVQNLFYLNNRIHDVLYSHGFTESAGNFQENNFGKGGAGSDSVNAEAQDGGGTDNANFATPADGSNPRMQMYVWTATNPNRDGDFDSDIVWHEYGHGLTWRMIGQMSGAVSGAIGEGMGDVLAILQNNDDRVGEYSSNRSSGIRSSRYTNYPRTIGDFGGRSIHFDGEIYAATIWRLKGLFEQNGLSRSQLMDYLVDGMNFTPSAPDYMEMRDGILASAPSSVDCLVWQAFAEFGMGSGSSMNWNGSSITESFSVPSSCSGGGSGGGDTPTTDFPQPGVWYSLTNKASGNVLDSDSNGRVDQYTSANRSDKHWRFDDLGGGNYRIVNRDAGTGSLDTQPNNVVQWVTSTTSTREDKVWRLERLSDGSVRFDNLWNGRGYLSSNGSSAVIWNNGAQNDAATWVPAKVQ